MKYLVYIFLCLVLVFIILFSFQEEKSNEITKEEFPKDSLSPSTAFGFPPIEYPADNYPTKWRVELGKKIFFDPQFSADGKISCSSCHIPQLAFADTTKISRGINGSKGMRNTPSLLNLAWMKVFMLDGGVPTLELQALAPMHGEHEFGMNANLAAEKMKKDPEYISLSKKAYLREPDAYVITRALACYQRTLIGVNSRYDEFKKGNSEALEVDEMMGLVLFMSERAGCANCHGGNNFTGMTFENTGLYEHYADTGRQRITLRDRDKGKFRVPSLRNVAVTAPYMHDGSIKTLEEVIEHYNRGGKQNEYKSVLIQPLNLDEEEKKQLVAFLKTLTDKEFIREN